MSDAEPRRGRDVVVAVVALSLPVVLVVALHLWLLDGWRDTRPIPGGVTVAATVVGREAATAPRSDAYRVTLRYDGHEAELAVDLATYEVAASGTLEVEYDPSQPSRVRIPRNDTVGTRLIAVVAIDLLLVVAAVSIRRSARRDGVGQTRSG
ncbi:MAG: hypothetical protein KDB40_19990 [Acidimicrobiales bacterium]|nr:hypothetical protein [Acidimicrobiales bacterium]MCB9392294.1 hypothetical protein [Acidimicrobiaceae bacterium]